MAPPFIPHSRQVIDDDDVAAVTRALRSDWLTSGPGVGEFERAFAQKTGATHAVAVNSGTAALHAAMASLGIGPGDEVIVPPITFTATANCVLFEGGTPVFADVDPGTGRLQPAEVERRITPRTKAIISVDYGGHPCEYDELESIARRRNISLVCDACHALGASYKGRPVGSIGRLNTFSFHPAKHIATGEGGMITTDDPALAQRMRDFRTHGITRDVSRFALSEPCLATAEKGPWYYEMQDMGYNYRISDINCALGISQLRKLDLFMAKRRLVVDRYRRLLGQVPNITCPEVKPGVVPAWHLYPLLINFEAAGKTRTAVMQQMFDRGVGTQVHYIPVCLQPYYRRRFGHRAGEYPGAEAYYARELSLPMHAALEAADVERVVAALKEALL